MNKVRYLTNIINNKIDLSCGSTIHLTSIDVILLSSPKVHTYTWILLQLFDSYHPDKWTHESNELVIIIKFIDQHENIPDSFIPSEFGLLQEVWFFSWKNKLKWYIPCINFVLYVMSRSLFFHVETSIAFGLELCPKNITF